MIKKKFWYIYEIYIKDLCKFQIKDRIITYFMNNIVKVKISFIYNVYLREINKSYVAVLLSLWSFYSYTFINNALSFCSYTVHVLVRVCSSRTILFILTVHGLRIAYQNNSEISHVGHSLNFLSFSSFRFCRLSQIF